MRVIFLCFFVASMAMTNAEANRNPTRTSSAITAKSFLVATSDGTVIREHDGSVVRPIASISKLMVGLLASEQNLQEPLKIPTERQVHSSIPLRTSMMSRKELLALALVKSDNLAAQVLCSNIPFCVTRMNQKAQELGMQDTNFAEPTGLDQNNVSTARDLLKLLLVSSTNPVVTSLSSLPKAEIDVGKTRLQIRNTNPLTSKFSILLSKTGFTNPAGGCIVMIMKSRIFILLGSKNAKSRIPEMEKLVRQHWSE